MDTYACSIMTQSNLVIISLDQIVYNDTLRLEADLERV